MGNEISLLALLSELKISLAGLLQAFEPMFLGITQGNSSQEFHPKKLFLGITQGNQFKFLELQKIVPCTLNSYFNFSCSNLLFLCTQATLANQQNIGWMILSQLAESCPFFQCRWQGQVLEVLKQWIFRNYLQNSEFSDYLEV